MLFCCFVQATFSYWYIWRLGKTLHISPANVMCSTGIITLKRNVHQMGAYVRDMCTFLCARACLCTCTNKNRRRLCEIVSISQWTLKISLKTSFILLVWTRRLYTKLKDNMFLCVVFLSFYVLSSCEQTYLPCKDNMFLSKYVCAYARMYVLLYVYIYVAYSIMYIYMSNTYICKTYK